jgi:CheY-like chemotaxis protein
MTTHGITLSRMGNHQHARLTLQSAVEIAENASDLDTAGQAALTIIEELGEHLTVDNLTVTYEHALDLLSSSKHPTNKDRLLSCARRVLSLAGVLPLFPTWENFSLNEALRRYEARIIERALKDAGGIVTQAARLLGFKYHNTLIRKLNKWHQDLLPTRSPIITRKSSLMFIDEGEKEIHPLTILHVEDNKLVADMLKESLETEGWTVESLHDGTAALEMISSDAHYDVLIFDNELPGLNGIELIYETRRLPHRQQTPIIMFSASEVEKDARRAGASAFLRKPEEMHGIAETVARLLARKPKHTGKGGRY